LHVTQLINIDLKTNINVPKLASAKRHKPIWKPKCFTPYHWITQHNPSYLPQSKSLWLSNAQMVDDFR
jgi:hypothetical protein